MNVKYYERGESIDFLNETNNKIEAKEVVTIGSKIGIAGKEIEPGAIGSLHVTGVFLFSETSGLTTGQYVKFDGSAIVAATDITDAHGWAIQATDFAGVTPIKLLG